MDRRGRDTEDALHIDLRWRVAVYHGLGVNERQILTLPRGELWGRFAGAIHHCPRHWGIPAEPGQPERYDYEYRRNGTANLFVVLDAHRSWRHVKVTEQRTAKDFAACMRDLVDTHYPKAELIPVVLDNLSTHTAGALYETFPAPEAHRILRRLEFHHTPKHASWLNMVEIEIGVLRGQCLDRRIGEHDRLICEIAAWQKQRIASGARINWKFNTKKARNKLARAYPDTAKES